MSCTSVPGLGGSGKEGGKGDKNDFDSEFNNVRVGAVSVTVAVGVMPKEGAYVFLVSWMN